MKFQYKYKIRNGLFGERICDLDTKNGEKSISGIIYYGLSKKEGIEIEIYEKKE